MEHYVIKNISKPSSEVIESYQQFDVSTIYEAQGKKGLLSSTLKPISKNQYIAGPAVTVQCAPGDNLMIHAAIEVCQPGDILVITTKEPHIAGMIGDLIATALQYRKVKGVIIDSGVRDVQQLREMGFPVWSKEVIPKGTTKKIGGFVNGPVSNGETTIDPGDLIVADDDGVVVVKKEEAEAVINLVHQRMEKEKQTRAKILNGELSLDFYNLRPVLEMANVKIYDDEESFKIQRSNQEQVVHNGKA